MAEDQRLRPSHQSPPLHIKERGRGPRSLFLKRSENGFGFTLRHFIVYPPESYTVFGGDKRAGLRGRGGPMDTIFVKSVRAGSPAALAGLATGDRLLSVNGETTAGRPYATVIHLIQQSPSYLHLLVVPKEEDILQLYFGETAHNPETNQRPGSRLRSPECGPRLSPRAYPPPPRRTSDHSGMNNGNSLDYDGGRGGSGESYSLPGCRLSLDAGMVGPHRAEHSPSPVHTTDDSLIMSRIRKSCEQKEEFLKRPVWVGGEGGAPPRGGPLIQREFYSRAGKLQAPIWPPAIPASQAVVPPPDRGGFVVGGGVTNPPGGRRLDRIQESSGASPPPSLHLVSEKARLFEQGKIQVDRTVLYRSELARLGAKRNVPNVAVRRREFENRAADWRAQRESRSLDSTESLSPPVSACLSGNRTTPTGSGKIHCDPPHEFHSPSPERSFSERPRSNSVEGVVGTVIDDENSWPQRHKAVRQDSYLAAVRKPVSQERPVSTCIPEIRLEAAPPPRPRAAPQAQAAAILRDEPTSKPKRPTTLRLPDTHQAVGESSVVTPEGDSSPQSSPGLDSVIRRNKSTSDEQASEDERVTRRVSYLKATWGDRMHVDSDLELSDSEPSHRSVVAVPQYDKEEITLEGSLICKISQVDGKKAHDRSWKTVWALLRGSVLYIFKDKKDVTSETPVDHERVELRGSVVGPAEDYTKRRHVLRLSTPSASQILLQAESPQDMATWLQALQNTQNLVGGNAVGSSSVSPVAAHKGIMKLTTFRNRSPTGQSPVNKTRKPSQTDGVGSSTSKSKTWKGRVAKQLRRMGPGSPTAPHPSYPEGATIGVPLELCPPSPSNEFVPLLVERCTSIVEERGLEIIGIYRVPGNTAAVTSLTEAVNLGLDWLAAGDPRWSDVNVISSLLKSFFRRLPDSLLTTELYPLFIQADKIDNPRARIATIRKYVHELPEHHYQTLKHLMEHLKRVVEHSSVNKMEARNLAIVFGPTLVRAGDDNMVTMVTDMSHQCRIVESLILHVDWCFSDEGLGSLELKETPEGETSDQPTNQTLLLDNIHKVEGMKDSPTRDVSARDIVSSIITAANRKMQKARSRKALSSEEPPTSSSTPSVTTSSSTSDRMTSDDKQKADSSSSRSGGGKSGKGRKEGGSRQERCGSVGSVVASGLRESVLFSGTITNKLSSSMPHTTDGKGDEKGSNEKLTTKVTAEDGTIRTYTGLSETTQERIRRFEMETKAMLQREVLRRESESPSEWLKKESSTTALSKKLSDDSSEGEKGLASKEVSPLVRWKQHSNSQAAADAASAAIQAAAGKRLKTDSQMSLSSGSLTRRGSLDSLKDSVINEQNNLSDECGDLVVSLTSTFDAKMRSLGLMARETQGTGTAPRDPAPLQKQNRVVEEDNKEEEEEEKTTESCNKEKMEKEEFEKDEEKENCGKLRRSESGSKKEGGQERGGGRREAGEQPLKRADSLTKTEKTECNLNQRRRALEKSAGGKMKRKTGGLREGGGIKRRHTVGGTKDFDRKTWLDNREREKDEERERRTSSPDLSRPGVLAEVRPLSLVEPLESHI